MVDCNKFCWCSTQTCATGHQPATLAVFVLHNSEKPRAAEHQAGRESRRRATGKRDVRTEYRAEGHVTKEVESAARQGVGDTDHHHEPREDERRLTADGSTEHPSTERRQQKHQTKVQDTSPSPVFFPLTR